jgi:hypothetical protein
MQLQQNSSAQQQMPNPVDQIALSELRAKLADAQKLLETERAKHQRQMASIRFVFAFNSFFI